MTLQERMEADYLGLNLTTGPHPMALLRHKLPDVWRAVDLKRVRNGQVVRVAGQVICRQRPGTAKGVCFISLEDETGISNIIVHPGMFDDYKMTLLHDAFIIVEGVAQNQQGAISVRARHVETLDVNAIPVPSHDFH